MSGLWKASHAALLGVLAGWATYSSLLSQSEVLWAWGIALSVVAAASEFFGLRTANGKTATVALGLVVAAYLPAALATAQPALLLLGFTCLALLDAAVGSALPLIAQLDHQRVLTKAGSAPKPAARLFATAATTATASFLLSVLLINGGLLLAAGAASEWSVLLAALAVLAIVAILATLPRRLSEVFRPRGTKGTKAERP